MRLRLFELLLSRMRQADGVVGVIGPALHFALVPLAGHVLRADTADRALYNKLWENRHAWVLQGRPCMQQMQRGEAAAAAAVLRRNEPFTDVEQQAT